jgi:hypothetical protein
MSGNSRRIVVQERDRHLLRELSVMRVADREQAKTVAGFGSTTRVNARLLALTRAGLLRRFFVGTGGTKAKAIYAHTAKGAALAGVPYRGPRRRPDEQVTADLFVEHQLATNDVYCGVKFPKPPVRFAQFRRWHTFYEPIAPGLRLIPDGYFELETASGTLAAFLEVDLGNEPLGVWREKVKKYLQLAVSGEFKRRFGQNQFRVLVVALSERRMKSIRQTVAAITPKIFWFATREAIQRKTLFAPIWYRPTTDNPEPLIEELR